ncbi:MAG: hypothetical protein K2X61_12315 [Caulobacteraceae bacterium]|nr:hypothetical protein [Caulobacteraceae bacterium]
MLKRLLLAVLLGLLAVGPAMATPRTGAVSQAAEPLQFYVFSFTDTPASEAATDIVSGALAHDLKIDPAVDGVVTFRADGWYSEDALLSDFGTALLDQDIALVRTGAGAYALVPRINAPMLMARGGQVMRLAEPSATRQPSRAGVEADEATASVSPWWEGAAATLTLFFAGAAAGAAALFAAQAVWRRAAADRGTLPPPLLRLTDQRLRFQTPIETARQEPEPGDPELIIPRFEDPR